MNHLQSLKLSSFLVRRQIQFLRASSKRFSTKDEQKKEKEQSRQEQQEIDEIQNFIRLSEESKRFKTCLLLF